MFSLLVAVDPQGRMFLTLFSLSEPCVPKCSLAKWSGDVCFRSTGSENPEQPTEFVLPVSFPSHLLGVGAESTF